MARASGSGTHRRRHPEGTELSSIEEQIAGLVTLGRTNKEIAQALQISVKTVEWNLTRLYRKVGVETRTELAVTRRAEH